MMDRFVDANIFIRHITNDNAIQSPASRALFAAIGTGQQAAWTSDLVVAEVVFVLAGKGGYNLGRDVIRNAFLPLLDLPSLALPDKPLIHRVFDLYTSLPIDFMDAYHAALVERRSPLELYSYDRHFDRIPTLRRLKPAISTDTGEI